MEKKQLKRLPLGIQSFSEVIIVKVGINFDPDSRTIGDWSVVNAQS